ncbi:MAG: DNA polymerase IV [Geminicoccaceae bacterium]
MRSPVEVMPAMRKIIHVDMDAFYASVEQRDDPSLRGLPVAVGGGGARGVVMAASYEARKFGVRSAMPGFKARRLCPELIFVKTRFDAYKTVSRQIRDVFKSYTDLIEPLSLDEAFLDVTDPRRGGPIATEIASEIKREIREKTKLTASAGVSYNKFLAKIASDLEKPDGLTVIRPDQAEAFIAALPVERFFGVGPVTAKKMKTSGIHTGQDLRDRSEAELVRLFGKVGRHYHRISRGIDEREVKPDRPNKSIGAETTFDVDLTDPMIMLERLQPLAERVIERAVAANAYGRTVTLKIKYRDFTINTRQRTLDHQVDSADELMTLADWLIKNPTPPLLPVRLLGLSVSTFDPAEDRRQLSLEL